MEPIEDGNGTPRFASAVRGYDRMQVDDYIERLHEWIEQADARAQQCEAAAARAKAEVEQMRRRLASVDAGTLSATPESLKTLGDQVEKIMQSSFHDAEDVRRRAEEAATRIMEQATARAEELSHAAEELFVQAQEALAGAGAAAADQIDAARAAAAAERDELVERALTDAREMDKRTRAEEAVRREQLAALEQHRGRVMEEIGLLHQRLGNISEGLTIPAAQPYDGGKEEGPAALPEASDDRQDETMVLELPAGEEPRRRRVASSAR